MRLDSHSVPRTLGESRSLREVEEFLHQVGATLIGPFADEVLRPKAVIETRRGWPCIKTDLNFFLPWHCPVDQGVDDTKAFEALIAKVISISIATVERPGAATSVVAAREANQGQELPDACLEWTCQSWVRWIADQLPSAAERFAERRRIDLQDRKQAYDQVAMQAIANREVPTLYAVSWGSGEDGNHMIDAVIQADDIDQLVTTMSRLNEPYEAYVAPVGQGVSWNGHRSVDYVFDTLAEIEAAIMASAPRRNPEDYYPQLEWSPIVRPDRLQELRIRSANDRLLAAADLIRQAYGSRETIYPPTLRLVK